MKQFHQFFLSFVTTLKELDISFFIVFGYYFQPSKPCQIFFDQKTKLIKNLINFILSIERQTYYVLVFKKLQFFHRQSNKSKLQKMQALDKVVEFVKGSDFFWYHGYGLTLLWIVASTVAILAKKINLYLHALLFFVVDVATVFLVGGAFYRYASASRFSQWSEWSLVKQLHIFGGMIIVILILLQHVGGVSALLSASKRSPQHKRFAFWVSNSARVIVVLGWIMKGGDTSNLFYVSVASAVLLLASFYTSFIKKNSYALNPEQKDIKAKVA